jgi:hypothetical protein
MADLLGLLTGGLTAGTNVANARMEGRGIKRDREQADLLAELERQRRAEQDKQATYSRDLQNQDLLKRINAPEPERNIDPLSPEGIQARLEFERQAPKAPAAPAAPRNIDPLSPQGIESAAERARVLARETPPRTSLPTEGERKAAGLLMTGENGYNTLESIIAANPGKEAPGLVNRQLSRIGMGVGNIMSPDQLRQMDQAAYDLQEAWLRLTSGAAIGADEIRNSSKAIIPQPGDDDATLRQKATARRLRIEALRQAAGRALDPNVRGTQGPQDTLDAQIDAALGRNP